MVSFTCDACGNTVKKNQVEKHYNTQCRNCSMLSCIDCGVDFPGDSYITHTSCISEAEKYQGHLYQPKDKENKGDAKQREWIKNIQNVGDNIKDQRLKKLLERISEYSNIPRKKKKFENFCKNSVNVYDEKTLNALWDHFIGASTNQNGERNNNRDLNVLNKNTKEEDQVENTDNEHCEGEGRSKENEDDTSDKKKLKMKKKKRKRDNSSETDEEKRRDEKKRKGEETDESSNEQMHRKTHAKDKFNWHKAIKTALKASEDNQLAVKKLRKKVLCAYQEHGVDNRATTVDECRAMFDKKLRTYSKIKVKKDVVKLI